MDLHNLIGKCKKGDRKSQKALYDMFSAKFYAICLRYAKDTSEAEDILQDSFIKIFNKLSQYNDQGSFEGWMRRIVTNTAIDHVRKNSKLNNIEEEAIDQYVSIDMPDSLAIQDLIKIIQGLPEGYRVVFNMYAIEGYSHKEISDKLGISEGTSKSQLSRARKIIQEKIIKLNTTK